jgi:hypothetical protein
MIQTPITCLRWDHIASSSMTILPIKAASLPGYTSHSQGHMHPDRWFSPAIVTFPASFSQRPLDQSKLLPPVSPLDGSMTAGPNSAGASERRQRAYSSASTRFSHRVHPHAYRLTGLFYPLRHPFAHCGWSLHVRGPYISVRQGVSWRVPVLCSSLPFPIYRPGRLRGDRMNCAEDIPSSPPTQPVFWRDGSLRCCANLPPVQLFGAGCEEMGEWRRRTVGGVDMV